MTALRKQDEGKFFVSERSTGNKGWLVMKTDVNRCVAPPFDDNKTAVRLDRPGQTIIKEYSPHKWAPMQSAHPISEMAKAKIAYAALRELANALGDYDFGRKGIETLKDDKRIAFMEIGPTALDVSAAKDVRHRLWKAIMGVLG